jgi:hypothetical protein
MNWLEEHTTIELVPEGSLKESNVDAEVVTTSNDVEVSDATIEASQAVTETADAE